MMKKEFPNKQTSRAGPLAWGKRSFTMSKPVEKSPWFGFQPQEPSPWFEPFPWFDFQAFVWYNPEEE